MCVIFYAEKDLMSKKFNLFQSKLTVTDNKVTISNAPIGDYATKLHIEYDCVGVWVPNRTTASFSYDDGVAYGGTYAVNSAITPKYHDTSYFARLSVGTSLSAMRVPCGSLDATQPSSATGVQSVHMIESEYTVTITDGEDSDNENLYRFLSKYYTKQ